MEYDINDIQLLSIHRHRPIGRWAAIKLAEKARHWMEGSPLAHIKAFWDIYKKNLASENTYGIFFTFGAGINYTQLGNHDETTSAEKIASLVELEKAAIAQEWIKSQFSESTRTITTTYCNPNNVDYILFHTQKKTAHVHHIDTEMSAHIWDTSEKKLRAAFENIGITDVRRQEFKGGKEIMLTPVGHLKN